LTIYTNVVWRQHDVADANAYVELLARMGATHQQQAIRTARELLSGLAELPVASRLRPGTCRKGMGTFRAAFPYVTNFGILRPNGEISCSAIPLQGPSRFGERPFFRQVLETRGLAIGGYQAGNARGVPAMYLALPLASPGGRVHAVAFAELDLSWLGRLVADANLPAGITVALVDREGTILAREPDPQDWRGRSAAEVPVIRSMLASREGGTAISLDVDGVRKLFAFRVLPGLPEEGRLYLAAGIPYSAAFDDADRILARSLGVLGVTGILVIGIAFIGGDFLVLRRIRALVAMAQRLRSGDLSARSGVSFGAGELDELAGAFDSMAGALERRQAEAEAAREDLRGAREELERRVRERTAELEQSNEALLVVLLDLQQVEERLRASEAQLAAVIDSATEAIITADDDQHILLFNRAAERIFRLPAAEAIGQPVRRFIPTRFLQSHQDGVRALTRGGEESRAIGHSHPATALRADGEEFPIEAAAARIGIHGKTLSTIILRDITERRKAEETLRKLSSAVEQTAESVVITNRDGVIEYANAAFEQQTGYSRIEAIGRTHRILKSDQHPDRLYEELWERILSGHAFRGVFVNRRKNGELYYEEKTITPIRDERDAISHFVASGRDVTQRKRTEEALLRLTAQLEREAERIAHALHDEAGQFLTTAHIALAEAAHGLPPEAQQRLQDVRENLNQIEEQLRRLSRELRPRILDDLGLKAALEFLADGVRKRSGLGVDLEVDLEGRLPSVMETALYRLIQESLTNAARHANATRMTIRLMRERGAVRCAIQDNGIGFNVSEILARQGDASLGLVGIRDRLEALGGTLHIESVPGQGTEFLVLIPLEG
jgi:PAS domain S-box-containing protein